ncbi:MAG TPA: CocE/NonD family hydrolase [Vicinamibacterales bacterium]|jgi:putative CocE/NonD family hydrolase
MKWRLYALALVALSMLNPRLGSDPLHGQTGTWDVRPLQHFDEVTLSKPSYRVRIENDVRVTMRDGVTLSVDIYRPDAQGQFPSLLVRTPYNNNTEQAVVQSKWFAERGYVVIQGDVRGKFDSGGDFYPFRHEPDDGFDTDEWIAKQPWYNGKIGTMGGSYVGFTQWSQAIRGSRHLTAMAPTVTTPDIYGNWFYTNGALNYAFALSWGGVSIDGRVAQFTGAYDWPNVYRSLPLLDAPARAGHRALHYRDWVQHATRDAHWNTLSHEDKYDMIGVPILTVEGWYDIFLRGALQDHMAVASGGKTERARRGKRLMIGPWVHSTGRRNNTPVGQAADPNATDFGPSAEVDLQRVYLRWFDYWLKGIENGVLEEPPVKIFVMGENYWRYEREWPLARTQYTDYYLASGGQANSLLGNGTLSTTRPPASSAESDSFTYDPANPVPTLGGNVCCAAQVPSGPWDQRAAERRDDVLVFTSEELKTPVEVTGPMVMKLYASTTARDTDWTAKLVDVGPDGFARNVQDGIVRARSREAPAKPQSLIEPGRVYEYSIDMWATSNTFMPGHRIRLEISSSNFPRFDRNLNTGEDPTTGTRMDVAKQTIYHSARYPSRLVLPVIPRGTSSSQ